MAIAFPIRDLSGASEDTKLCLIGASKDSIEPRKKLKQRITVMFACWEIIVVARVKAWIKDINCEYLSSLIFE